MNDEPLDVFWYFVNERQQVYLNKEAGEAKPWTEDKILQEWKFCNIFRSQDRATQEFLRFVPGDVDRDYGLALFNTFLFRGFNWTPTYEVLGGWQTKWDAETAKSILEKYVSDGNKLISSAYMIRGKKGQPKWQSIPEVSTQIWDEREDLTEEIFQNNTLQFAVEEIIRRKYWGWGPFTAYQVVLDLTYIGILDYASDMNTWCSFGPGAKKGLKILFPDVIVGSEESMINHCIWLLRQQGQKLGDHVSIMNLQDIEFALCEFAKYWRILNGGRMKERYIGQS